MNSATSTSGAPTAGWLRAHRSELNGFLFVALFAAAVTQIAAIPAISGLGLSPLIIGIAAGVLYGNAVREAMPESWAAGVNFAARRLLRIAVAFYGLRISFQEIATVGVQGFAVSASIVVVTLVAGTWIGTRVFKLDREEALLTAAGSAICGAAAVLAFESTLQSKPHKSAIAVGTVVLFGTLSMFLYPALIRIGFVHLDTIGTGLFFGGTIHEVAQVVGAASAVSPEATHIATIVKMTRVLMLVPVLLVLTVWLARRDAVQRTASHDGTHAPADAVKRTIAVPWFALGFLALVGVNSLHLLPDAAVHTLNTLDTFALTMAMTALGIETRFAQIRQAGPRALFFGLSLYVWLIAGGLGITYLAQHLL
ncbi:YeiH family protein [Pararobbsia silviterrae]|uniref:YeiH family putative sulfate export transporter n=1 Tax=Pararobbsia silviterrae TaxID=1792498 RepID=A0A494XW26_9BURK|nr:YeiH family protein [Pararobbsia silviterrae]RKP51793.1 YeiH family putative sulfate export transporter [Pararobbsia silviterrae]